MQAELKALGKDINLYIKDSGPNPRIWRWLFRMTVQVLTGFPRVSVA